MLNVRKFLDTFDIPYVEAPAENVSTGWIGVNPCPSCGRGWQCLGVNVSNGAAKCWVCGYKSSVYDVVKELSNAPAKEIYTAFKESKIDILGLPYKQDISRPNQVKYPHGILAYLPETHKQYLTNRQFDPDFLELRYNLKATQMLNKQWQYRIIYPVYANNQVVSYVGQSIFQEVKPKYRNSKNEDSILDVKDCLFGVDEVGHTLVLTEGLMDAIRFGSGAVCTFGVSVSNKQILTLKKQGVQSVVLAFDPDEAGEIAAQKVARKISLLGLSTSLIDWGKNIQGDVGDMSNEKIHEFRKKVLTS